MPIRIELTVILWVIVASAIGLALWSRPSSETLLSSPSLHDSSNEEQPTSGRSRKTSQAAPNGGIRDFGNIAIETAGIFSSQEVASSAQGPEPITDDTQNNIILRGIIGAQASLRAVFDDPTDSAGYVVLAEGESIAGNRITGITPDSVSLQAPGGAGRSISLRGSGEAK